MKPLLDVDGLADAIAERVWTQFRASIEELIKAETRPMHPKRLFTDQELAKRWGCSVQKIRRMRALGTGPKYIKPHGTRHVRYDASDVEAWEAAGLRINTIEPKGPRHGQA